MHKKVAAEERYGSDEKISWGKSIKEMKAMCINEIFVNQYVKSASKKLGTPNRSQALRRDY
ncbi:hypothetical protein ACFWDG_24200 [Peribacillus sp. NPDC060186]